MADTNFDVIVLGSGPGGYVAAIRAAQLGVNGGRKISSLPPSSFSYGLQVS